MRERDVGTCATNNTMGQPTIVTKLCKGWDVRYVIGGREGKT